MTLDELLANINKVLDFDPDAGKRDVWLISKKGTNVGEISSVITLYGPNLLILSRGPVKSTTANGFPRHGLKQIVPEPK